MAKPRRSIKLTPGKIQQITSALELLEATYEALLADWHLLTDAQRAVLVAHSPLLVRLLALTEMARG